MTRRERLTRKAERRLEWAEKATARSASAFNAARTIADGIPLGQPILVGHHSEKRHRRAIERIDSGMRRGCENAELARTHEYKAAGLEAQLESSIYSDDANALAELEARIAERIAERERMTQVNKLFRKGDAAGLEALGLDLETLRRGVALRGRSWAKAPYEPYELSNLGGRITSDRKRLEDIKRRQERATQAEAAGGLVIRRGGDYCSITFADKPERAILADLREAGFSWGGGSWSGRLEKLPASVTELEAELAAQA